MDRFLATVRLASVALIFCATTSFVPVRAAAPPIQFLKHDEIARLLVRLGSVIFSVRDAAMRTLREHPEAELALRRAPDSPDAEVRRRVERLLKGYRLQRGLRAQKLLPTLVAEGRADEFIERAVVWRDLEPESDCWRLAGDLAWRMYQLPHFRRARALGYDRDLESLPWGNYQRFREFNHPRQRLGDLVKLQTDENFILACGERIVATDILCASILIASSGIKVPLANGCILLANGSVDIGPLPAPYAGRGQTVVDGLLIADGEVRIRGKASGIIIASGKITCDEVPVGSTLISASGVEVPKGTRLGTKPQENRITRNDPTLQGLIRFYTLAQAGLEVRASRRGLVVTSLDPRKPFAGVGFRLGDEILTVNGKPVRQPEALRVLLRRLAARGSLTEVAVRRGYKVLSLHLRVP
jgi:hypothetical protein